MLEIAREDELQRMSTNDYTQVNGRKEKMAETTSKGSEVTKEQHN